MVTAGPPRERPRPRELGVVIGTQPAGARNAITDVPGVRVGHATVWRDEPRVVRSGVTAVLPDTLVGQFGAPMAAGTAVLNGAGELTGSISIGEWGVLDAPILLTSSFGVGAAFQGVVEAVVAECGARDDFDIVAPVVGECDDSWLSDRRALPITADLARAAIADAGDTFAGGAVGAGTGMTCFDHKGGIGTSSRLMDDGTTVGVLALTNFGWAERLTIAGRLVGPALVAEGHGRSTSAAPPSAPEPPEGSCIVVVATDAPLDAAQCTRLARRCGLGLARVGSFASHGSGEIFCAFSTTNRTERGRDDARVHVTRRADTSLNDMFRGVVDATEEAVLDSLFRAGTVVGVDGHVSPELPVDRLELSPGR
jgi:D-aminopeptidase